MALRVRSQDMQLDDATGTLTLEVNMERRMIYVHVLHLHDLEKVRGDLHRFEELALRAFGSPEELAASEARREAE